MIVTLMRLQHTDINLLRELRNANRKAFFDTTYVTEEMQADWWYRYGFDLTLNFYTIWLNNVTPVGFLSVRDITGKHGDSRIAVCEVGNLLLAPAHRGRGIMHAAITEVRRLYDPLTFWIAYVKPTNTASLKLFARQDFVQIKPERKRKCEKSHSLAAV